jgi:SAM-dependent methyltransferase
MAAEANYVMTGTATDAESARLAVLEAWQDPGTLRRLDGLNIAAGSRCLEVGAGRGSIARWLSAHVGPDGHVVAADIDCRFLTGLPDNVEVRTLDIRHDDLEPDTYDLVHSRALLIHLPDPTSALQRLSSALRPGGVLLAEEADYSLRAFGGHPNAQWCTDLQRRVIDALTSARITNGYLGRTLPALLLEVGLEIIGGEVEASIARPGDVAFEFERLTAEGSGPALIAAGLMTEDEHARRLEVLRGTSTVVTTLAVVSAWARRGS